MPSSKSGRRIFPTVEPPAMQGALDGIRILDLTTVLMGPYATQLLADMGADVIKVEPPEGDLVRHIGPMRHPGMGSIFLHVNRNKRSIALDLKQPAALAALLALARDADVVVCNIRKQAMQRLGITYERLRLENPAIIYASLCGYGENGPYAGNPAYDDLIQGAAAIPSLMQQASGGEPRYVPLALADRSVGLMAANAILAAIIARSRTGSGQEIEVPMFETMAQLVLSDHLGGETFLPALGPTGYARLLVSERRPYRTRDGYLCMLLYTDRHWRSFLALAGMAERCRDDARFASIATRTQHIGALYGLVAEALLERSTAQWIEMLTAADIACTRLHDVDSLIDDLHLRETGFIRTVTHPTQGLVRELGVPVRMSATPAAAVQKPAPTLGQHTEEVLREAGLSPDEIAALIPPGAARNPSSDQGML